MKQKLLRLALLAGGLAFGLPAFAAGVATPAMLSSSCNACHGTDGNSAGLSNPTIAGFGADYLETAMKQFKSGERPSSVMGRLAKGYDEAQLKAMADFFASKKFVAAKQAFDATKAKQGAKLHDKSCKMCHGNGGKLGVNGVLAGQWRDYLGVTLAEYRSGKRKAPEMMAKALTSMSEADLAALTDYYASQQ
ncbi:MAG: c-type cytochrome [Proteobacteria bacterium]|nr:c-type cytochrome [Pseudomonadota bacterium]